MMSEEKLKIRLLYFDGCPSWKKTLKTLEISLEKLKINTKPILIPVETQKVAEKHHFIGSPTIRIDGEDLFPSDQKDYALGCRIYQTPEGLRGWPTEEMISDKLNHYISLNR